MTIDGPAASGKSALGRALAARLGSAYLDTGLLYRAVTALALETGTPVTDGPALAALAERTRFDLGGPEDLGGLRVDGRDLMAQLRSLDVDTHVSTVSAHAEVRQVLLSHQCELAARGDIVMVGRDIGTVVLPGADLKLYLVASPEVRAERRWRELLGRGVEASYPQILADLTERDRKDTERTVAPLKPAADAVTIDTDRLTLEAEVDLAERLVAAARPGQALQTCSSIEG